MSIIEHGNWATYTPPQQYWRFAEASAQGVILLYAQRSSDGKDWYTYCYDEAPFASGSVKITVRDQGDFGLVVGAATHDATAIWPAGALLIEETSYGGSDPQADYGNKVYDPATQTFSDLPPPAARGPTLTDLEARITALEAKLRGM